ncbi:unnamed protein product [Protopolystoma xenopodis]|uniref:Uncharacterized protein n=1 Tax=Protopolystoma xenopodis TaxID=117903 RepID=A0A448XCE8_9PLAT|nr:unnamed protein product [Protopolystoma xenopodis]
MYLVLHFHFGFCSIPLRRSACAAVRTVKLTKCNVCTGTQQRVEVYHDRVGLKCTQRRVVTPIACAKCPEASVTQKRCRDGKSHDLVTIRFRPDDKCTVCKRQVETSVQPIQCQKSEELEACNKKTCKQRVKIVERKLKNCLCLAVIRYQFRECCKFSILCLLCINANQRNSSNICGTCQLCLIRSVFSNPIISNSLWEHKCICFPS